MLYSLTLLHLGVHGRWLATYLKAAFAADFIPEGCVTRGEDTIGRGHVATGAPEGWTGLDWTERCTAVGGCFAAQVVFLSSIGIATDVCISVPRGQVSQCCPAPKLIAAHLELEALHIRPQHRRVPLFQDPGHQGLVLMLPLPTQVIEHALCGVGADLGVPRQNRDRRAQGSAFLVECLRGQDLLLVRPDVVDNGEVLRAVLFDRTDELDVRGRNRESQREAHQCAQKT